MFHRFQYLVIFVIFSIFFIHSFIHLWLFVTLCNSSVRSLQQLRQWSLWRCGQGCLRTAPCFIHRFIHLLSPSESESQIVTSYGRNVKHWIGFHWVSFSHIFTEYHLRIFKRLQVLTMPPPVPPALALYPTLCSFCLQWWKDGLTMVYRCLQFTAKLWGVCSNPCRSILMRLAFFATFGLIRFTWRAGHVHSLWHLTHHFGCMPAPSLFSGSNVGRTSWAKTVFHSKPFRRVASWWVWHCKTSRHRCAPFP